MWRTSFLHVSIWQQGKGPGQRDTMFYYIQNRIHKPDEVAPREHLKCIIGIWRDKYDMKHDEDISDPNQSLETITVFMQKIFDFEYGARK